MVLINYLRMRTLQPPLTRKTWCTENELQSTDTDKATLSFYQILMQKKFVYSEGAYCNMNKTLKLYFHEPHINPLTSLRTSDFSLK